MNGYIESETITSYRAEAIKAKATINAFANNVTFNDYALAAYNCGCFSCVGALMNVENSTERLAAVPEQGKPYIRANIAAFKRALKEIVASETVVHSFKVTF